MAEEVCDFSQLPVSGCAHCRAASARSWRRALRGEAAMRADAWQALWAIAAGASQWADWWYEADTDGAADRRGPWVASAFRGTCAGCGERWEEGDDIRADDDVGGWVGRCCAE